MSIGTSHIVFSAENLSVGYSSKRRTTVVAKDIDFQFLEGELVSLVGANGIGKSTLLRTLSGMQKPLNGTIVIQNKEITKYHSLELATQLSVVLTEAMASKNLTVLEFVSLGRQPHTNWMGNLSDTDLQKIDWALSHTDTASLQDKPCFELSDGQLQRVAIARALAQDTPIIILDEPTTHLDIYHRAYILKLLKKLAIETKKTILFATHEIDLAIQLTHKMMIMTEEKVVVASPQELIQAGHFETLFPKDSIFFDTQTGRFTIKD